MTDMTLQQAIDEVTADRDKFDHPTGVTVISHQAAAVLVNAARAQLDLREQLAAMTQRAEQAEADVAVYKTLLWGAAAHHTASRRDSRDNRHDAIVCIDYLAMLFEAAGASGGFAIGFTEPAAVKRVASLFGIDPDELDMALDDATQQQAVQP